MLCFHFPILKHFTAHLATVLLAAAYIHPPAIQGFLLLPLFHFQLFFFLLESMGGNGFVVCLGWVLVPSVVSRCVRVSLDVFQRSMRVTLNLVAAKSKCSKSLAPAKQSKSRDLL